MLTPVLYDAELAALNQRCEDTYQQIVKAEDEYAAAEYEYERAKATVIIRLSGELNAHGKPMVSDEKEARVRQECDPQLLRLTAARVALKTAQAAERKLARQTDVLRSAGTNMRLLLETG